MNTYNIKSKRVSRKRKSKRISRKRKSKRISRKRKSKRVSRKRKSKRISRKNKSKHVSRKNKSKHVSRKNKSKGGGKGTWERARNVARGTQHMLHGSTAPLSKEVISSLPAPVRSAAAAAAAVKTPISVTIKTDIITARPLDERAKPGAPRTTKLGYLANNSEIPIDIDLDVISVINKIKNEVDLPEIINTIIEDANIQPIIHKIINELFTEKNIDIIFSKIQDLDYNIILGILANIYKISKEQGDLLFTHLMGDSDAQSWVGKLSPSDPAAGVGAAAALNGIARRASRV
jgi:hypothetical protein